MNICLNCYKKLYRKMFSPYDYVWSKELKTFISTCCGAEIKQIDGRQYHAIVKRLTEERRLREWKDRERKPKDALPGLAEAERTAAEAWGE